MAASTTRLALISVTDKTGVLDFAKGLAQLSFKILSTGGTAKLLRDAGISVTEVAEWTKSPEILGGRVKTLHPMIHGGILADRTAASHLADMERMGWPGIDVVVVNLYDFAGEAQSKKLTLKGVQAVLYKMDFYNRTSGYIAYDTFGDLTFFDSEPSFGGSYVTRDMILYYIWELEK